MDKQLRAVTQRPRLEKERHGERKGTTDRRMDRASQR